MFCPAGNSAIKTRFDPVIWLVNARSIFIPAIKIDQERYASRHAPDQIG
jgi:hypothetical protein